MAKTIPLELRFWRHVAEDGECWRWTGAIGSSGYGRVRVDDTIGYAHRVAYELMVGEVPDGLQLDHLCRNRKCVNPYHLDPVTPLVNTRRGQGGAAKTHCPQGHAYAGDNVAIYQGRRQCRTCNMARSRAYYQAQKAKAS